MINHSHENQTPQMDIRPPYKGGWSQNPQPDDPIDDDLRRMENESPLVQYVRKDKKRFFGRKVQ
jgi:hypothetical protein